MALRVGVDIGGTFTDVAMEEGEARWSVKVPTTHAAPDEGVLTGLRRALAQAGRPASDIALLVHGTTLATNALIERKGARTALLTTDGFRDVLEMGDEGRFDQYDLDIFKPAPIVPRSLRFTVAERLRHDGSVVAPLDLEGVRRAAVAMGEAAVAAVAVGFLHAYADGAHERAAREVLTRVLGVSVPVSISSEVSPEIREYERLSTTCANAYLQPVVSAYLLRLQTRLAAEGLARPMLMILSSGSLTTVETASRFPVRLLESGPAGGAIFACDVARRLGLARVLSLDVGGTTAKFCMIDDGRAHHALRFEVGRTYRFKKGSGLPVRVPVVDLVEIGAGGGSIARMDSVGRVVVGPDSAGSEPGPACYGRGGARPTVTDCDLVQGKLDAEAFAGGSMRLDATAAERAVAAEVGGPAGLTPQNAAFAVAETLTEGMASAARVHAAEVGAEVERRTLVAFGGGAPLHAVRFAQKLGISHVVVPQGAGVGSAIGFLHAPPAYEVVRTVPLALPGGPLGAVREALAAMEAQAEAVVSQAVADSSALVVRRSAYMRYVGQGHEIEVAFDHPPDADGLDAALLAGFGRAYLLLYDQLIAGAPVEVTAWAVRVQQREADPPAPPPAAMPHPAEPARYRRVFNGDADAFEAWPEYDRMRLLPGAQAAGPAIVAEDETTTVVPAGFCFAVDAGRFLHLTREG